MEANNILTRAEAEKILTGSLFLGCGGGGAKEIGEEIIEATADQVVMYSLEYALEHSAPDDLFITISPVGSPASQTSHCGEETFTRIIELIKEKQAANPKIPQGAIAGVIPCEIGAASAFGPFMTAVKCNLPVVDASCDGRAHPLGVMGSLGLEKLNEPVIQVGAGGDPEKNMYVEVDVFAAVDLASNIIRTSSSNAGGLIEVARNPVTGEYLKKTSAAGAYQFAKKIGEAFDSAEGVEKKLKAVCEVVSGESLGIGTVEEITLETKNALDYGKFKVSMDGEKEYMLYFCNEYMAMDGLDGRKYTFPDFIVTANAETGEPISTAKLKEGDRIYLLGASRHNMLLGEGVRHRAAYERLEEALGIEMTDYIEDILND